MSRTGWAQSSLEPCWRIALDVALSSCTSGMFVCYIIWTALTGRFTSTQDKTLGKVVLAFVFFTNFCYAIAWAPLLQAYTVEIYPYTLRGRGISALYRSILIALVLADQVNPIAVQVIGWTIHFCCILFGLFWIIWLVFPETRGHILEDIRNVFEGGFEPEAAKVIVVDEGRSVEKKKMGLIERS